MSIIITMKDIAEAMGVSVVSVSKALAGKKGVSEETRVAILDKADELGYKRAEKKSMQLLMQGNIGILVADRFFTECAFYASMYSHLLKKASDQNYIGILEMVDERAERECRVPRFIQGNKVSGIVIMGEMPSEYVNMIAELKYPYILLDFYNKEQSDSVVSDGVFGAYKLTNYLIKLGHRDIGFIGSRLATSSIMDRFLGFYKAMLQAGLPVHEEWILEDRDETGHFLEQIDFPAAMPTAFVCNCDEMANLVMEMLKARGLRIPQDISIVGFDDFRFATMCTPPLTTFHVNIEEMCEVTISRLVRKIRGKRYTEGRMVTNGNVVLRRSAAPPKAKELKCT